MRKAILIGLDGCTFDILDPLAKEGAIPFLNKVMSGGARATLLSTTPASTIPGWNSIFTGVNPGKHGVIEFLIRDGERVRVATSKDRMTPSLWRMLSDHGVRVIVVNEPVTYPPEHINGVMLTGFSTPPSSRDYVYPSSLTSEIEKVGYKPELASGFEEIIAADREKGFQMINEFSTGAYNAATHLAKSQEWDLLAVIFTSTDRLQHFYLDDWARIKEHYRLLDGMLSNIHELNDEASLFIVSDHGFGPLRKCFFINTWLESQGLVREQASALNRIMTSSGLTYNRLVAILRRLHLYGLVAKVTPHSVKEELPQYAGEGIPDSRASAVTSSETNGGLYFKDKTKIDAVLQKLRNLEVNGEKPIEAVFRREEIWTGPYASRAPDIAIHPAFGYEVSPRLVARELDTPLQWGDVRTGTHRQEGIFLSFGPNIRPGAIRDQFKVWDVTPTILRYFGISTYGYMDGVARMEIYEDESRLEPLKGTSSQKEDLRRRIEMVRKGLKH